MARVESSDVRPPLEIPPPARSDESVQGNARTTFLTLVTMSTVLGIAGALLYWFNPVEHSFFPQCILYRTTGLQCPGCGGLRATHQLLHGHLAEAFRLNALFVCLIPLAGWYTWDRWRVARGRSGCWPFRQRWWLKVFLTGAIAFSLGRNLPGLGSRLAPHFPSATRGTGLTPDAPAPR